jgi:hypothetical protein
MARRTAALKPQLNQIRTWAREGRTDAWIAYQLGTTALTVQEFRSEHGLDRGGGAPVEEPVTPEFVVQTISFDTPPPAPAPAPDESPDAPSDASAPARTRRQRRSRPAAGDDAAPRVEAASEPVPEAEAETPAGDGAGDPDRTRRRRRRGGRGGGGGTGAETPVAGDEAATEQPVPGEQAARTRRRPRTPAYTGSVVAGAVIVLDPAIARSAAWRAHWADANAFDVVIDDEQIVLRRRSDS